MSDISGRLYNEVMLLDSHTCVYCGLHDANLTVDHVIARSEGGADILQNLVACCLPCNTKKGARALYEANLFPMYGRYSYVRELVMNAGARLGTIASLKQLMRQMHQEGADRATIGLALYQELASSLPVEAQKAAEMFMSGISPADITRELRGISSNQGATYQRALNEVLDLIRDGIMAQVQR